MDVASRTRKCKCGHTWNQHDKFQNRAGDTLIVCTELDQLDTKIGWSVCDCKDYEEEVPVPSA